MRGKIIRGQHEIPENPSVVVGLNTESTFKAFAGRDTVGNGAHAAYPLCELVRVEWVPANENPLEAPEHISDAPRVGALSVLYIYFNRKMTFYPCYRIN